MTLTPVTDEHRCKTLTFSGDMAGVTILVQLILFAACVGTVCVKYFVYEKPRRPLKEWGWDVSKQGLGAGLAHVINLLIAAVLAESTPDADPCAWYFVNMFIDTFVGVFIQFKLIETVERYAGRNGMPSLACSGDYGHPPNSRWWLNQLLVYGLIVALVKFCLFSVIYLCRVGLAVISTWLVSPLSGDPTVELVLVMIVAPIIMNAWQVWVVDTFIMLLANPNDARYPKWCCGRCCGGNPKENENSSSVHAPEYLIMEDGDLSDSGSDNPSFIVASSQL